MKYNGKDDLNLGRIDHKRRNKEPLTAEEQAVYDEALSDPRRIMEAAKTWERHLEQLTRASAER
jgi:hypothetical protein